jgi:hypothetical protein
MKIERPKMQNNMFEVDNEEVLNLVMLAKASSEIDPIDFKGLKITEDQAYVLMASHVLDMERNNLTDGAIIVKLLVENFILNLKLLGKT